ncbi:MAG: PQQ-dependent sugar dehydrogenase [Pseudomonadota bacterium]
MRHYYLLLVCALMANSAWADSIRTSAGALGVDRVVTGLDEPWGFGFLPGGGVLITERGGRMLLAHEGQVTPVRGVPRVSANGQGGLLDVLVPRDFAETREILFTYASAARGGDVTTIGAARLSENGARLENARVLLAMNNAERGGRHFGSRLVEARDGTIFATTGDRGNRPAAQDTSTHHGTVVRINRDGSIPRDNPFVQTTGARPEIWSYGHRNAQGAAIDQSGQIWTVEHGAAGGDEINRLEQGANFGWPVISYGRHYSGQPIGDGTSAPGMEQPAFYWDPSIAPSGMMIYSGKLWPEWRGDIFVGSLKFDMISRVERGGTFSEAERIAGDETLRVRDIREAPDGTIWFLSVGNGALYRLGPDTSG